MSKRDFLSVDDVEPGELAAILDGADRHKADRQAWAVSSSSAVITGSQNARMWTGTAR